MRKLALLLLAAGGLLAQNVSMGRIHIITRDAGAHKKLWVGVLGAKESKLGNLDALLLPDVTLTLVKGEPAGGTEESAINHLGFKVKNLADMKARLTAAGGKVVREMPETKQMFILFPDDIKVEFSEDASMTIPVAHHHVHFFTHDLEAQRAWYVKLFGAKPGVRGKFQAADLPGVNLTFSAVEKPTAATRGRAVDHVGFEVRGLADLVKKLRAENVKVEKGPRTGKMQSFTLTDPFGVLIELTEGLPKL